MVLKLLYAASFQVSVWMAGDFFAQFYAAHHAAARRRAAGEKRVGEKPSMGQMMAMVDQPRLGLSATFGLLLSPFVVNFQRICANAAGSTSGRMIPSFAILSAQQLFMTPLTLLAYHNLVTAVRGGFSDPSFLRAHQTNVHAGLRYDAMSVERHILVEAMPGPLVASWGVFAPLALANYMSVNRVRGIYAAALFIPWTAYVSYTQSTRLL